MKQIQQIRTAVAIALFAVAPLASADDTAALDEALSTCKAKYPNTTFKSISPTPFPEIYELEMGRNIIYSDKECRYVFFGHLFDMETQTDLTAAKLPPPEEGRGDTQAKVDFKALPKTDAIVTKRGKGTRKIAVFSDPDCPYCKQFEQSIKDIDDITIYTYLFPLEQLHPDAKRKAIGIWCAKDRSLAWDKLMREGVVTDGDCDNPVDRNIQLGESLRIRGTPTIILEDGMLIPGALPASRLEAALKIAYAKGEKK